MRLIDGRRSFDSGRSLLDNLNSITDSLISAEKKQSDRSGVVDYAMETWEGGNPADPISAAVAIGLTPEEKLRGEELLEISVGVSKRLLALRSTAMIKCKNTWRH